MAKTIILSGALMIMVILYGSFSFGYLITKCLKRKPDTVWSIVTGFGGAVTLFEVLFLFVSFFKMRFLALVVMYGILAAVIICIGTVLFIKNKEMHLQKKKIPMEKGRYIYIGIIVVLIGMQMFLSSYLEHFDDDDGYFVTISNIALEEDKICLDLPLVYDGVEQDDTFRPQSYSWELFIAFFAKIFNIHPAILAHTVLPGLLILLCYLAVYDFGKKLFKTPETLYMFLGIYAMLNIFGGYVSYSTAGFLLLKIWQGKSMLVNFAFPVLLGSCIEIYKEKENTGTWIINFIAVVSGIAFSVVGIYLMPIYYFVIGMPYLVYCGYAKRWERIRKLLINVVTGMLPVIIYAFYVFYMVINSESGKEYMQSDAPAWAAVFDMTMGQGSYFVLFLLSFLYLMFYAKGRIMQRLLFCGMTICNFLTFLNPLFCSFVSQKITGVDVYWRLYWMLPIYFAIAYVFAELLGELKELKRYVSLALIFVVISLSGLNMYEWMRYFSGYKNIYKLPQEGIYAAEELLKNEEYPTCIFPEDLSAKIRQYTPRIAVVYARNMSTSDEFGELYQKIYGEGEIDTKISAQLKNLNVHYIYSRDAIKSDKLQQIAVIGDYGYLYNVKG